MSYITVCTPTYNRAHTLHRVFESLKSQTFKDFEWLIIDDGSSDNTESVVNQFKKNADFPIRYYYKENGGRHTALNFSYDLINSEYVINCDSDDELTSNALALIKETWESIPKNQYDRFWCISGRCIDSETREIIGKKYPIGINKLKGMRKRIVINSCYGEKHCCRKVDILKQYPFPVFSDTKFVTENMVWEKINQKYDQYCVNDVYSVYYSDSPDSLAKGKMHSGTMNRSAYYASKFYVNEMFTQIFYNKRIIFSIINLSKYTIMENNNLKDAIKDVNRGYKKLLVILTYPCAYIYLKLSKNK